MHTRRDFLKDTCRACLGTTAFGVLLTQMSACSPLPVFKADLAQKNVDVPLISFGESNMVVVRDLQTPYDILLIKKSDTEYNAIYMKCTHRENPVSATKTGLYCAEHGSTFDLDGQVTKEPALAPLKKFATTLHANVISIDLNS